MIEAMNGLLSGATGHAVHRATARPTPSLENPTSPFGQVFEQSTRARQDPLFPTASISPFEQAMKGLSGQSPLDDAVTAPPAPVAETPDQAKNPASPTPETTVTPYSRTTVSADTLPSGLNSASESVGALSSSAHSMFNAMLDQIGSTQNNASVATLLGRLGDE